MDLLDRMLGHDAWTTRLFLVRCQELDDEQLDCEFDLGHRTVRAILLHTIWNMEVWTDLLDGKPVRADAPEVGGRTVVEMIARLDRVAADFARVSRSVRDRNAWDQRWIDYLDNPPTEKTYGAAIAHVITHSMHHRAQVLYLLRLLGLKNLPEGDVLSWENSLS
jgi:uncharacterized damage-inducible protein DinB